MLAKQISRAGLFVVACAVVFATGTADAWQPVVNEITVGEDGRLSQDPVVLHQPEYRSWLNCPEYADTNRTYTVYDIRNYKDVPMIVKIVCGGEFQCFTNLCPGSNYIWSVGGKSGTFRTEQQAPRTLMASVGYGRNGCVRNFRDLGGLRLINGGGRRTQYGVLFRSENWDKYFDTHSDFRSSNPLKREFGIKTEIDMRQRSFPGKSGGESGFYVRLADGTYPEEWTEVTNTLWTEVCEWQRDKGPYKKNDTFTTSPSMPDGSIRYFNCPMVYGFIDKGYSGWVGIPRVFTVLGQSDRYPLLFHCASGNDRTGTVAFWIEALCGVRLCDIRRDYLTSAFSGSNPLLVGFDDTFVTGFYEGDYGRKYGPSLAGRVMSYLEGFGVTTSQVNTITTALVGETFDQVLARVTGAEDPDEPDVMDGINETGIPHPGDEVTEPEVLERGGDEVRRISDAAGSYYVHYFTNTTETLVFSNNTGKALSVRYLAVGGGGAGGDSYYYRDPETGNETARYSGGGGGGGGVLGDRGEIAADEVWTIRVGKGGSVYDDDGRRIAFTDARIPAKASVISRGGKKIADVPGGGAGGSTKAEPTEGAAGGGAGALYSFVSAASGTYRSSVDGVSPAAGDRGFSGGRSVVVKIVKDGGDSVSNNYLAGGGGGAGGAGQSGDSVAIKAGDGGPGLYSDISGVRVMYGAGGGAGGGNLSVSHIPYRNGGDDEGIIAGAGANGGGRGGASPSYLKGNAVSTVTTAAQDGVACTGGGGGGSGILRTDAGCGGSGVVIIRYAVEEGEPAPPAKPTMFIVW